MISDRLNTISEEDYWKPTPKGIFRGKGLNEKEIKECLEDVEKELR
jgi:hypothetical protein